ncbi:MAG: DUF1343 domain-containing protein [Bacteroidota bacterium]
MVFCTLLIPTTWAGCVQPHREFRTGASRLEVYLPLIGERCIALVANHRSVVNQVHLLDTLLSSGVSRDQVISLFSPEHGFRGAYAAGELVEEQADPVTGIPVVSLYGRNKKPGPEQLKGVDLVLFDLQDVGTRFYTYISTLHYVMEACAENRVPLVVLDRPNPHGGYVDGPVLDDSLRSFVGMHLIPVVYGMTMGELARMINGEGWLAGGICCDLTVVPCEGYSHGDPCSLPVRPSPNLANDHAIMLYPSTCFFEGTILSEGRGTPWPFEVYGHPEMQGDFTFTPVSMPGVSPEPRYKGQRCFGEDLRQFIPGEGWNRIQLQILLDAYRRFPVKEEFFTAYFDKLAGTTALRKQIRAGWDEARIRASWKADLDDFMGKRKKYLIYD